MEVNFLRKRDINNLIKFTDLSSPDYDPKDHGNVQFKEGMRKIRAVLPDNTVVTGVEVFRRTYEAIGLGWVFAATNLPIIGNIADFIYDAWAENRLRLTGRGDLADQLAETAEELRMAEPVDCEDSCDLDFGDDDDEPPLEFTTEVEKDLGA
jgi:predicted DCC family thiol-disulfide oxidoreductase YuxK